MIIAVLGSDGRSGRAFSKAALEAGYEIRGGYRTNPALISHTHFTAIKCEGENSDDIRNLLAGADIVVSLIGHVKGSKADTQTISIKNVISVMNEKHMRRLISLTGTGVRFPKDKPNIIDKLLNLIVKVIDPKRISDGTAHAQAIRESSLDWTILRVLKLQNSRPKPYILTGGGPAKLITSRAEVANALIEIIENDSFIRQAPVISKK